MTELDRHPTHSADGTRIAYYATQPVNSDAPTVVLVGAMGAHDVVWRAQLAHLSSRYRILAWDPRGLCASGVGPSRRHHGVDAHVADLRAVLAAEGVDRVSLIGWAAGVRIVIECCVALSDRIDRVILVGGSAGRTANALRLLSRFAVWLNAAATAPGGVPARLARSLANLLARIGLAGPLLPHTSVNALATMLCTEDPIVLLETFIALETTAAFPLLDDVDTPALVLAGDRDPLMPAALAHQLARKLRSSEVLVVAGGHRYLQLEYPDLVNLRIERFLADG